MLIVALIAGNNVLVLVELRVRVVGRDALVVKPNVQKIVVPVVMEDVKQVVDV